MTDGTQEYPPHRLLDQPEIGGLAQNVVRLTRFMPERSGGNTGGTRSPYKW